MTDFQNDYDHPAEFESVSGGDNFVDVTLITDSSSLPDGADEMLSVSGNDRIYILTLPQPTPPAMEQEIVYTLWDKPLEEYSVSEGLLLIMTTLAIIVFIWNVAKGGFSWLDW